MTRLPRHLLGTGYDNLATFETWRGPPPGPMRPDTTFLERVAYLRNCRYYIGVVNGCFDLFHPGHANLLRLAADHPDLDPRSNGIALFALLNSDASVARLKGPHRPVLPLAARLRLVTHAYVRAAAGFDEDTPEEALAAIRPDFLFKGDSYAGRPPGEIAGAAHCGAVVFLPETPGFSTSSIEKRILAVHGGSAASRTDGPPPSPERP